MGHAVAEHQRLAHGQALIDGARSALQLVAEADEAHAEGLTARAIDTLASVADHDPRIGPIVDALERRAWRNCRTRPTP